MRKKRSYKEGQKTDQRRSKQTIVEGRAERQAQLHLNETGLSICRLDCQRRNNEPGEKRFVTSSCSSQRRICGRASLPIGPYLHLLDPHPCRTHLLLASHSWIFARHDGPRRHGHHHHDCLWMLRHGMALRFTSRDQPHLEKEVVSVDVVLLGNQIHHIDQRHLDDGHVPRTMVFSNLSNRLPRHANPSDARCSLR